MNENQLKRIHSMMQMALDEVDRICDKLGLRYFLIGGTLLGAVRHKGFIPWDDDLDVVMPRADYNIFLEKAPLIMKDNFFLQTRLSDPGYGNMFSKILVNNTAFVQRNNIKSTQKTGIFVDIFPLDFGHKVPLRLNMLKICLGKSITSYIFQKRNGVALGKLKIFKVFPDALLIKIEEFLYKGRGSCYVNYGSQYGIKKQTIDIEHYEPPVRIEFEGRFYCAPKDYEYVLERIFGSDYMTLPPKEKRITHNPIRLSFNTNDIDEVL